MVIPISFDTEASPNSPMIRRLFAWLEEWSVRYVVLRNWEGLPAALSGNDLDLLVAPKDVSRVATKLVNLASEEDWLLIQDLARPYIRALKFAKQFSKNSLPEILHVDLFTQANWRLFCYRSASQILKSRIRNAAGIYHLPQSVESFHTVTHHLLWTGRLHKVKYVQQLAETRGTDEDDLNQLLASAFGPSLGQRIAQWALKGGEIDSKLQRTARTVVMIRALRNPVNLLRLAASTLEDEARAFRRPRGLFILNRAPLERSDSTSEFVDWLSRVWKYNHAVLGAGAGSIIAPCSTSIEAVERIAYAGVTKPSARVRRLWRLRRRGWILIFSPDACRHLPAFAPDLVVDLEADLGVIDAAQSAVLRLHRRGEK